MPSPEKKSFYPGNQEIYPYSKDDLRLLRGLSFAAGNSLVQGELGQVSHYLKQLEDMRIVLMYPVSGNCADSFMGDHGVTFIWHDEMNSNRVDQRLRRAYNPPKDGLLVLYRQNIGYPQMIAGITIESIRHLQNYNYHFYKIDPPDLCPIWKFYSGKAAEFSTRKTIPIIGSPGTKSEK